MGREIRRVIANWEHPQREHHRRGMEYQPMFDDAYIPQLNQWWENHQLWERGEHPDQKKEGMGEYKHYAQWAGDPPDHTMYRPDWKPEEMTWYQVYETVSEGTPVTPPFATREELVDYLVANGDFWDQRRRKDGRIGGMPCEPWTRKQAESFVMGSGWAPSLVMHDGKIQSGVEALAEMADKQK